MIASLTKIPIAAACLTKIAQVGLKSNEITVRLPIVKDRLAASTDSVQISTEVDRFTLLARDEKAVQISNCLNLCLQLLQPVANVSRGYFAVRRQAFNLEVYKGRYDRQAICDSMISFDHRIVQ